MNDIRNVERGTRNPLGWKLPAWQADLVPLTCGLGLDGQPMAACHNGTWKLLGANGLGRDGTGLLSLALFRGPSSSVSSCTLGFVISRDLCSKMVACFACQFVSKNCSAQNFVEMFEGRTKRHMLQLVLYCVGTLQYSWEDEQQMIGWWSQTRFTILEIHYEMDQYTSGSTISTLLHDKINPKDCQVLSLGDFSGFSNFLGLFQVIMANPVLVDISKTNNSSTQIKH